MSAGSEFDENGAMKIWWTNETRATYVAKGQAIVDQYNAYVLPEGRMNGRLTLGENIADNGGLKAAIRVREGYSLLGV